MFCCKESALEENKPILPYGKNVIFIFYQKKRDGYLYAISDNSTHSPMKRGMGYYYVPVIAYLFQASVSLFSSLADCSVSSDESLEAGALPPFF